MLSEQVGIQASKAYFDSMSTDECIMAVSRTDCMTFQLQGGLSHHEDRPLPQPP